MKTWTVLAALVLAVPPASAAVRVTDDAGHTLLLPKPAQRVISIAPSLTEILFEAGGGGRLVGAVDYSDYPPAARAVPRIGSNQKLDLERIARLEPDLVLVWFHGNASREVDQLAMLGIPMFYAEPHHIDDIPGTIERVGQLMGTETVARAAAERFRMRHRSLGARYAGRPAVTVVYQIADNPLLTINDRHIIADAIRLCGGRNLFSHEPMLVPHLSTESVVAANPDVILTARLGGAEAVDQPVRAPNDSSFAVWARFSGMKAVKTGQLWLIPADPISRHGPRILDGAQAICTALEQARTAR